MLLLDLPPEARAAHLARGTHDDPVVLREVESLLRATQQCGEFLATPARRSRQSRPASRSRPICGWVPGSSRAISAVAAWASFTKRYGPKAIFAQRVAIKLLRQRSASRSSERFHVERQILARLEHPGIARLYDGGIAPDGRPYMVMELVTGEPITEYCTRTASNVAAAHAPFHSSL